MAESISLVLVPHECELLAGEGWIQLLAFIAIRFNQSTRLKGKETRGDNPLPFLCGGGETEAYSTCSTPPKARG